MRLEGLIGETLGRYKIEALIGRGGMAAVYRAFDPALQRNVALKVLYPQFLADPSLVERFRREAITAASLDHPYIAPIYDVGDADGLVYLAMKLLPGPSLADLLQREGRLSLSQVVLLTSEIAAALEEAHAHGIVHRDIKPGNVLFDARGRAMLTDFGIAKSLESSSLTESSVIVGTPDYIAPEQIDPRLAPAGQIDGRADIYALGAMVYRALSGRRPFDGSSQTVLLAHLQQEPPPLSTVAPELPADIDAVIARAMAKHPEDRYASAGEFARDLGTISGDATEVGIVIPASARRHDINTRTTTALLPPLHAVAPDRTPSTRRMALGMLAGIVLLGVLLVYVTQSAGRGTPTEGASQDVLAAETTPDPPTATASPTSEPTATTSPTATSSMTATATTTPTATLVSTATVAPSATSEPTTRPRPSATRPPATATPRPAPRTPTTARPPQRTATATRTATVAPSETTIVATEEPATPTEEPTPTSTIDLPTPEDTPVPTSTPEPVVPTEAPPLPPTDTPAHAQCDAPLEGGFGTLWRAAPELQARLGCPTRAETAGAAAEQLFENGMMYWWSANQQIYVLAHGVGWSQYPDTYRDGESLGEPLAPPSGMYAPERGFGKVWRSTPAVERSLGWAAGPEVAITGVYQRFERGMMLHTPAVNGHGRQIYVLFGDGTYGVYPDPGSAG